MSSALTTLKPRPAPAGASCRKRPYGAFQHLSVGYRTVLPESRRDPASHRTPCSSHDCTHEGLTRPELVRLPNSGPSRVVPGSVHRAWFGSPVRCDGASYGRQSSPNRDRRCGKSDSGARTAASCPTSSRCSNWLVTSQLHSQVAAQYLPGRGLGNRVDECDASNLFVWCDVVLHVVDDCALGEIGVWSAHNECMRCLITIA